MPDSPATTQAGISPGVPPTQTGTDDGRLPNLADGGTRHSRKLGAALFLLLLVVGIALVIAFFAGVRHWLALHTGTLHGGPDLYYNFWSGFGSDLGEATLISAVGIGVYTGVRKVNCHTKGVGGLVITRWTARPISCVGTIIRMYPATVHRMSTSLSSTESSRQLKRPDERPGRTKGPPARAAIRLARFAGERITSSGDRVDESRSNYLVRGFSSTRATPWPDPTHTPSTP